VYYVSCWIALILYPEKMNIVNVLVNVFVALVSFSLLWIIIAYFSGRVETLSYTLLSRENGYQIRSLNKHILAETQVEGSFDEGSSEAFKILAGYIFGKNKEEASMAMTSPVIETKSIKMTAPVITNENEGEVRKFAFVMPESYTVETLPKPTDSRITIREVEAKNIAVLSFSGFYSESKITAKKELLKLYLKRDGLTYSNVYWAGYNPPWTPPFMRRLEIWAELLDQVK
jgi:hypothetical protein